MSEPAGSPGAPGASGGPVLAPARSRVDRAVAWVSAASSIIGLLDVVAVVLLNAFFVSDKQLGVATIVTTVTYYLDLATESGMSSVLIQRDKLDDDTVSTVWWMNLGVSSLLFAAMFVIAPAFGRFQGKTPFEVHIVTMMLLMFATKLVWQNVYFAPMALLRRELRFKEVSIVRTIANACDMATKIGFAAAGQPIYCFIAGPLVRALVIGIGIQICRPWRPRLVFRPGEVRTWLAFGAKTTASQYLQHFYNTNSFQVVGHYFSASTVGAYRVAHDVVMYPVNFISNVIAQVSFPAFARLRGDRGALAAQFLRFSRQNLAVVLPVLVVILAGADDVITVIFPKITQSGAGAGVARVLCIVGMLRAIDCLYLPLLEGVGMPGRNVVVAAMTAGVLFTCDLIGATVFGPRIGLIAVAIGRVVGYPIVIAFHAYLALGQAQLKVRHYIGGLIGILGCGALAVAVGLAIRYGTASVLTPGWRLLAVTVGAVGTVMIALDRFQGLGVRTIVATLKTKS